jgi:hypothetical protein
VLHADVAQSDERRIAGPEEPVRPGSSASASPWCNGSIASSNLAGPGSNPGGFAWHEDRRGPKRSGYLAKAKAHRVRLTTLRSLRATQGCRLRPMTATFERPRAEEDRLPLTDGAREAENLRAETPRLHPIFTARPRLTHGECERRERCRT